MIDAAGGGSGVDSIEADGAGQLTGDVTLSEGANVTLTQAGNDIEIAAGAGGGGDWDATVVKASDEALQYNATLQADNHLLFTTVSGGVYLIEVFLIYTDASGGARDMQVQFGEDGTSRGCFTVIGHIGQTDTAATATSSLANNAGGGTFVHGGSTGNRVAYYRGWYVGNGGNFTVWWAQNVFDVQFVTVKAGSLIRYERVI